MQRIRFINDINLEYNQQIMDGLHAYNRSQTGFLEKDARDFYIIDDGTLVAACHTKQASDWCHLSRVFYKDLDALKALMNDIRKYYRQKVVGIQYHSVLSQRVEDFKTIGFQEQGKLEDMPYGNENVFLLDKDLEHLNIEGDYDRESSKEPIAHYDKTHKREISRLRKSLDFSTEITDIQYVVLDKDTFVGGIYGNIQFDYLFINVLFVKQKYRGNRIASKLMHLIEAEALRRNITNIYLTTFEFQALGFYKKHGYRVVMVIDDYPKGFKEYTVYKQLQ